MDSTADFSLVAVDDVDSDPTLAVNEHPESVPQETAPQEPPETGPRDTPETCPKPTVFGRKRHSKGPKRNRKRLRFNEEPLFGRDTGYICSHCHGIFWGPLIRENLGVWKFCPACGSAFSEGSQVSYSEIAILPEEALSERMDQFEVVVTGANETENQLLRKLQKKYNNSRFCDVCGHAGVDVHCSECPSSFHKSCMGILANFPLSHRWTCNACIHHAHEKLEKHVLVVSQTCRGPWKLPEQALQCCSCGYHEIESTTCDSCCRSFCFACMCLSNATVPPDFWHCPECIGQERYDEMLKENIAKSRERLEGNDISSKGQDCFSQLVFDLLCACAWEEWYRNIEPLVRHVLNQLDNGEVPVIMPFHALHYTSSGVSFDKGTIRRIAEAYAKDAKEKALKLIKQKPNKEDDDEYHAWRDEKIILNPSENGIPRLRIGYISSDFVDHPTADLIQSALLLHDDSKFEIFCYSITRDDDNSHYRKTIAQEIEHFRNFSQRDNDKKCAEAIAEDGIHILVNLNGHTAGDRNGISALRPAPVQLVYLAYPGTMGADYIDFNVADRTVCPEKHREFYTERILHMPYCYQTNSFRHLYPEILDQKNLPTRDDHQLPDHPTVVFCNFCRLGRITADLFQIWMNILRRVPNSVIWLYKHPKAAVPRLQLQAKRSGIPPERLVFGPPCSPKIEHLKRVTLADLCLDTIVYNGHTTASDMLWAGVPFVTVSGDNWPSLVATCIAKSVGMPEMAVSNLAEYEELAVKLGNDPVMLREWKTKLQANRLSAPLFDPERWIRSFESGLEKVWRLYEQKIQFPMDLECDDFGASEAAQKGVVGNIRGIENFEQRKHFAFRCDNSKLALDLGLKKKRSQSFAFNRKRKELQELKRLRPFSKNIRENSVMISKRTKAANSMTKLDRFSKLKKHREHLLLSEKSKLQGDSQKQDRQDYGGDHADFEFLEVDNDVDFSLTSHEHVKSEDKVLNPNVDSQTPIAVAGSSEAEKSQPNLSSQQENVSTEKCSQESIADEKKLENDTGPIPQSSVTKEDTPASSGQEALTLEVKSNNSSLIETVAEVQLTLNGLENSHALPAIKKDDVSTAVMNHAVKTESGNDAQTTFAIMNSSELAKDQGEVGVIIQHTELNPLSAQGNEFGGICTTNRSQANNKKKGRKKGQGPRAVEFGTSPQSVMPPQNNGHARASGVAINPSDVSMAVSTERGKDLEKLHSNVEAMTRFLSQGESQQQRQYLGMEKGAPTVLQSNVPSTTIAKPHELSLSVVPSSNGPVRNDLNMISNAQPVSNVSGSMAHVSLGNQLPTLLPLSRTSPLLASSVYKGDKKDGKAQHLTLNQGLNTVVASPHELVASQFSNGHSQVPGLLKNPPGVNLSQGRQGPKKGRKSGGSKGASADRPAVTAGFPCHPQAPEAYVVDLMATKRIQKQGQGSNGSDNAPLIYPNGMANPHPTVIKHSPNAVVGHPLAANHCTVKDSVNGRNAGMTMSLVAPASPGVSTSGSRHDSINSSNGSQEADSVTSILVPVGIPRTVLPPPLPKEVTRKCSQSYQSVPGNQVNISEMLTFMIRKIVMVELESHKQKSSANDSLQRHLQRVEVEAVNNLRALMEILPPYEQRLQHGKFEDVHYNQVLTHVRGISQEIAPQCIWLSKEIDMDDDL